MLLISRNTGARQRLLGAWRRRLGSTELRFQSFEDLKPRLMRPLKELKGFAKVFLKAGESKTVSIPLNRSSFAFYDPEKKSFVAEKGTFKILIGSSSRDIPGRSGFAPWNASSAASTSSRSRA